MRRCQASRATFHISPRKICALRQQRGGPSEATSRRHRSGAADRGRFWKPPCAVCERADPGLQRPPTAREAISHLFGHKLPVDAPLVLELPPELERPGEVLRRISPEGDGKGHLRGEGSGGARGAPAQGGSARDFLARHSCYEGAAVPFCVPGRRLRGRRRRRIATAAPRGASAAPARARRAARSFSRRAPATRAPPPPPRRLAAPSAWPCGRGASQRSR